MKTEKGGSRTETVTKEVNYSPSCDSIFDPSGPCPGDSIAATLTYEVPREAMRVEFECKWKKDGIWIVPHHATGLEERMHDQLKPLIGKRTRVTIEEVVE